MSRNDIAALSIESTCATLSCTQDEFRNLFYDVTYETNRLSTDVVNNVILPNRDLLRVARPQNFLDELLLAMLEHAPHPLGKRYLAVTLYIANEKGQDTVVGIAQTWMDALFFPILAMYEADGTGGSSSHTPTVEEADLRQEVASREQHYCAIVHAFDAELCMELVKQGRYDEIPKGADLAVLEVAHIIPPSLAESRSVSTVTGNTPFVRDMFQSWTSIDLKQLTMSNIDSPENAIYMTRDKRVFFGEFKFYLDSQPVRPSFKGFNIRGVRDPVIFPNSAESGVDPPSPDFIGIHAAFAKVLNLSGAAMRTEALKTDAGRVYQS